MRVIVKKSGDWWIGWLIDIPGVNAQEKTYSKLIKSLKIGAQDMLETVIQFEPEAQMTTLEIPDPQWAISTLLMEKSL